MDVITQALDSGANDYMPKPVNVKVLQVRLRVAERMLAQAQAQVKSGALPGAGAQAAPPVDAGGGAGFPGAALNGGNPRDSQIGLAIEQADAPIALVEVGDDDRNFQIIYANSAMTSTTQFEYDQLMGKSLADLEAWTPEFLKMVLAYVGRGAILSHVPLWSRTHQAVPVHLSFYPIRAEDDTATQYLVIHHF
jgi:hypothetical protein